MGPKSDVGQRAKVVWMWASGTSPRDIAKSTGASVTTIYRWIRRWRNEGTLESRKDARQSVNFHPFSGHYLATHASWCRAYVDTLRDAYKTQVYTWDTCLKKGDASCAVPGNEENFRDPKDVGGNAALYVPINPIMEYLPLPQQRQSKAFESQDLSFPSTGSAAF